MSKLIIHPKFTHTVHLPPTPLTELVQDLSDAPFDILFKICSYITSAQDLLRLSMVSQRLKAIAEDEEHWKVLCISKFNVSANAKPPSWRNLYRFNHVFFYEVVLQAGSLAAERLVQSSAPLNLSIPVMV